MRTFFTPAQMADPHIQDMNRILRTCVHCGFCNSTCPTYVLLGDELDSPRGRIYLIKDMLEQEKPASAKVTTHLDRCLSCLSCTTTCPSGVDYMHLIDQARVRVEKTYRRPFFDRLVRGVMARILPNPALFRWSLLAAWIFRPLRFAFPARLKAMLNLTPSTLASPSPLDRPQTFSAEGEIVKRVALLTGCAQQVLAPSINEATVRLLTRHGCEVVIADGAGCCGALVHHMGHEETARKQARDNILAWERLMGDAPGDDRGKLDAIVVNASGCGTMLKDYGALFRDDYIFAERAQRIASLTCDVSELINELNLKPSEISEPVTVTYQSACSMQHGQKIVTIPQSLLIEAGFNVREPKEAHLCCGSAGTYNILQPKIADGLRERKATNLANTNPDVVATGNIGCMMQLEKSLDVPIVHTVELLDWATGGPRPDCLR
ncbi:MAG: glycolate oxidase subunit GlcF [Rhodospirillales bacterium]|jgi:glycolate oxidase iron-sulfur subunit